MDHGAVDLHKHALGVDTLVETNNLPDPTRAVDVLAVHQGQLLGRVLNPGPRVGHGQDDRLGQVVPVHVAADHHGGDGRLAVVEPRTECLVFEHRHVDVGCLVRSDGTLGNCDGDV